MLGIDSIFLELCLIVCSLFIILVLKSKYRYRYFKDRGMPYLEPTVFFGSHAKWLLGMESVIDVTSRMYADTKNNPYIGYFRGSGPGVLIKDPELIVKVLIKDFSHFTDRGIPINNVEPLEKHLFLLSGDPWRILRNKLSPTFTSGKLKGMFGLINSCLDALIESMKKNTGDNNISDVIAAFTTDVIGSCAFGYEPSAISDPNCEFRRQGLEFWRPSLVNYLWSMTRFVFPGLFNFLGIRSIKKRHSDFYFRLVQTQFKHRLETGQRRNDFVDLLLQLKLKGKVEVDAKDKKEAEEMSSHVSGPSTTTFKLTDEVLTAQAFVFFVAGFETTGAAVSYTLYFLAKNPEIQDRAREEVRAIKSKYPELNYDAIMEMNFIHNCLKEALRLLPPLAILNRVCTKPYRLPDGKMVEKGVIIQIPVAAIQKDPKYHPDPLRYNPDRFDSPIVPGTYMPFGDGPRICIGMRFGLLEARMCLAKILDNFVVSTCSKTEDPIVLSAKSFVTQAKNGVHLRVTKIEENR